MIVSASRRFRILRVISVVAGIIALSIAGLVSYERYSRRSMEPILFTQCFRAFDQLWGSHHQNDKSTFYKDDERSCYGQRWSIPRAYYSRKYVSYHPITEDLVLRMAIPDLTPGALLPKEQAIPLFTEVRVEPLWAGRFVDSIRHSKKTYASFGWSRTGETVYGMEVYDANEQARDRGSREIFLFLPNDNTAQLFLSCNAGPDDRINTLRDHYVCKVAANIDDRVSAVYHIKYAQIAELTDINNKVVRLIRGFMTN